MVYTSKVSGPKGAIIQTYESKTRALAWVRMALKASRGMTRGEVFKGARLIKVIAPKGSR